MRTNEFEEYLIQGEPGQAEKREAWKTAIRLQASAGQEPSVYLADIAKDHIEGKISIDEAQKRIQTHYEQPERTENRSRKADIVSARIVKLLGEYAFHFSPVELCSIHRRLFEGVLTHAGQIRQSTLQAELDHAFAAEKHFSFEGMSVEESLSHLAKFAANIWQVHPFREGNTRAVAVFMIRYMRSWGINMGDVFEKHARYFCNWQM